MSDQTAAQARDGAARQTLDGLEFFQRVMSGEIASAPMADLLGFRVAEVARGRIVIAGTALSASTTVWASRTAGSRRPCSIRHSAVPSTPCSRPAASSPRWN